MLRCSVSDAGERCSACLRLQEVQSKIRECKELLEELYIQEAHIKSSVNAVHDPIIRNLPLELVPDIFMWCNPNPVNNYEEFGPLPPNAPLAAWRYQFSLNTVCKTWRNIIRSAPQLWTNIYIQFPTKRDDAQKEFLRLSLRLSGTLPLHIHTWLPRNYGPSGREHLMLSSLVEMLNDQSERWKTLDLHVTANFLSLQGRRIWCAKSRTPTDTFSQSSKRDQRVSRLLRPSFPTDSQHLWDLIFIHRDRLERCHKGQI